MPCSLCGEDRCACISSVLDAIEPPAAPEQHHAVVARLRPPPPPLPPLPPGPQWSPPPWGGGSWEPQWVPAPAWRGGVYGVRAGSRYRDVLVAEHGLVLVPAGMSWERLLFFLGLALGLVTALVGAVAGALVDHNQGVQRLRTLLLSPPDRVLATPKSQPVLREQVEAVRVTTARRAASATIRLRNGDRLRLRWTRQPEAPALLQAAFGDLATVRPRPLWSRLLRGAGLAFVAAVVLALFVAVVWAVVREPGSGGRQAGRPYMSEERMLETQAHNACVATSNAFYAAPERFGPELEVATRSMEQVAAEDARYQLAAISLRWFLGNVRGGVLDVTEAEAAPHYDTLDAACSAHLAEEAEAGSPTF